MGEQSVPANGKVETDTHMDDDDDFGDDDDDESHLHRPKRSRTAYSSYQLEYLEWVFTHTHYPDVLVRQELSSRLNIQEAKLQVCVGVGEWEGG